MPAEAARSAIPNLDSLPPFFEYAHSQRHARADKPRVLQREGVAHDSFALFLWRLCHHTIPPTSESGPLAPTRAEMRLVQQSSVDDDGDGDDDGGVPRQETRHEGPFPKKGVS